MFLKLIPVNALKLSSNIFINVFFYIRMLLYFDKWYNRNKNFRHDATLDETNRTSLNRNLYRKCIRRSLSSLHLLGHS